MLLNACGEEHLLQGLLKSPRVIRVEVIAVGGEDGPNRLVTYAMNIEINALSSRMSPSRKKRRRVLSPRKRCFAMCASNKSVSMPLFHATSQKGFPVLGLWVAAGHAKQTAVTEGS